MTEHRRRDPRAERVGRRRTESDAPDMSPGARRDPRAERDARRGLVNVPVARAVGAAPTQAAVTIVEAPAFHILVLADLPDGRLSSHDRDVLGAARALADKGGGAVAVLAPQASGDLGEAGADRVVTAGVADGTYRPERLSALAEAAVEALRPRHILAPDTLAGAGDVARRLAARRGLSIATAVHAIEDGRVVGRADGGARDIARAMPEVVLLAVEAAEPHRGQPHEARAVGLPEVEVEAALVDGGLLEIDANAVPLAEADFIVSAGNGVTDWRAFHAVAAALKAAEGGSRVVCDSGLLPRDRQVGASGTLVEPRCYLALGIAGAPQHLQGIERCERVVAVNTDLYADMVKRSDLAIIQDAQLVMPALVRRAKGTKQ